MMGKGQTGIVLLIIVGLVAVFIFLNPQILDIQPTPVNTVKYRNDIISLENFEISNLKPIQNSIVTVSFDVTNNGDKAVENLVIDFGGTSIGSDDQLNVIECEGANPNVQNFVKRVGPIPLGINLGMIQVNTYSEKSCIFDKIESLDTRKVKVNYKVGGEGTRTIITKVTYPYKGTREALIPIIDDLTVKKPPVPFKQSDPTYGPFLVDIIPPTKGWGIEKQPFEIKFKLRYLGSSAVGIPLQPTDQLGLDKDNFRVTLDGLQVADLGEGIKLIGKYQLACNKFKKDTVNGIVYPIVNDEKLNVNKEYQCNLQADPTTPISGYRLGEIKVNFEYKFEFQKTNAITVRRLP